MWTMIISPIGEKKITISTHSTKKFVCKKKQKKSKQFPKENEQAKRTQTKREKKTPCTNR